MKKKRMTRRKRLYGGERYNVRSYNGEFGVFDYIDPIRPSLSDEKIQYLRNVERDLSERPTDSDGVLRMEREEYWLIMRELNKAPNTFVFIEKPIISRENAMRFLSGEITVDRIIPKFAYSTITEDFYKYYNELTFDQDVEYDCLREDDALFRMIVFGLEYYYAEITNNNRTIFLNHFNNQAFFSSLVSNQPTDILAILLHPLFSSRLEDYKLNTFRIHASDAAHDWTNFLFENRQLFPTSSPYYSAFNEIIKFVSTAGGNINQTKCQELVRIYGSQNMKLINDSQTRSLLITQKADSGKYIGVLKGDFKSIINTQVMNGIGVRLLNIESDNVGLLKYTIGTFNSYSLNAGKYMDAAPLGIGSEYNTNPSAALQVITSIQEERENVTSGVVNMRLTPSLNVNVQFNNVSSEKLNYVINNIFLGGYLTGKLRVDCYIDTFIHTVVFLRLSDGRWLMIDCSHEEKISLNGLASILGLGNVRGLNIGEESARPITYHLIQSRTRTTVSRKELLEFPREYVIERRTDPIPNLQGEDKINAMFLKTLTDSIQIYYMLLFKHTFQQDSSFAMIIYDITCADYARSLGVPVVETRNKNIDIYVPDIYQSNMTFETYQRKLITLSFFSERPFVDRLVTLVMNSYELIHKHLSIIEANTPTSILYYASKFCLSCLPAYRQQGIDGINNIYIKLQNSGFQPTTELITIMDNSLGETFRKLSSLDQLLDRYEDVYSKINAFDHILEGTVAGGKGLDRGKSLIPIFHDIKQVFVNIDTANLLSDQQLFNECIFYLANSLLKNRSRNSGTDIQTARDSYQPSSGEYNMLNGLMTTYSLLWSNVRQSNNERLINVYYYHVPYKTKLNLSELGGELTTRYNDNTRIIGGKKRNKRTLRKRRRNKKKTKKLI